MLNGWLSMSKHLLIRGLPEADRQRVLQTLRLADRLGAETITLSGESVSEELLAYAHRRNVSKIIVGKPIHPRWRDIIFGSVLSEMVRRSGDIDIYIISGDADDSRSLPAQVLLRRDSNWRNYVQAVLTVAVCTLIARLMVDFEPADLIMVYLVGIVVAATRYGRGPSVLASLLSVATFDFFFVQPHLTFAVNNSEYVVTFVVMLLVSLVISALTARIKRQAEAARERHRQTVSLYAMSRELANSRGLENLIHIASRHISDIFDAAAIVFLPDSSGQLQIPAGSNLTENGSVLCVGVGTCSKCRAGHRNTARRKGYVLSAEWVAGNRRCHGTLSKRYSATATTRPAVFIGDIYRTNRPGSRTGSAGRRD
jgi:two-component system sensor histidine kinase KdpD